MAKFKVGDKVKVIKIQDDEFKEGIYVGLISNIKKYTDYSRYFLDSHPGVVMGEHQLEILKPTEKTWETLERGDIIIDSDRTEAMVLAVLPGVFLRSTWGNFDITAGWSTLQEGQKAGWTIKQPVVETEVEEVTMSDVCAKFGKEVKIKK